MLVEIGRKLLTAIPTLIGVSLVSFSLIRMVPGDPVLLIVGERGADPVVMAEMRANLGLDRPLFEQYLKFVGNALRGDLGESIISHRPVIQEFWDRFPATIELSFFGMLFALVLGIPAGILAAVKRNSVWDYSLMGASLIGYSMPIFWWGMILILSFSIGAGLTPVSGRIGAMHEMDPVTGFLFIDTWLKDGGGWLAFKDALAHVILPAIALGTVPLAAIARMTRSSLLEVLREDYIRTAKAKGMTAYRVIVVHAFRNALIPVVTMVGLMVGSLLTGAILTETIFSWPGIGKWIVASVTARDYPVIQGGILLIATMIVAVNISVDVTYMWINPRLRGRGEG